MIIDHDETQRSGVISLMRRGPESAMEKATERTLALSAIKMGGESGGGEEPKPAPIPPTPIPRDPNPREPLPPLDPPRSPRFSTDGGHKIAARVQYLHPSVVVWYGEHTKEFWVMDRTGLRSFADMTTMYEGMGWERV